MEPAAKEEKKKQRPRTELETEKKQRRRTELETGRYVPDDIVREILDRLPLKSLARFECACKLWSSFIRRIIRRRVVDEICRSALSFVEMSQRMAAQRAQLKAIEGLRPRRDRLKCMFDEVFNFVVFSDDLGRYLHRIKGSRDLIDTIRTSDGCLVDDIRRDMEILDGQMHQEAAAA